MTKTIEEAYREFKDDNALKGLSKKTVEYYNGSLSFFFEYIETEKLFTLDELNVRRVKDYALRLVEREISDESKNTYLRALRRFLKFCFECEYIEKEIKIRMLRTQKKIKEIFMQEEIQKILAFEHGGQIYTAAVLLLGTGIRAGSCVNIKAGDIDFERGLIRLTVTKNKKAAALPMTPLVSEALKNHIRKNSLFYGDYIFRNSAGNKYTIWDLYKGMRSFLEKLTIPKKGLHIFRRTFATQMATLGASAFIIQDWLGHSSVEMSKRYVALSGQNLSESMEKYNPTAVFCVNPQKYFQNFENILPGQLAFL